MNAYRIRRSKTHPDWLRIDPVNRKENSNLQKTGVWWKRQRPDDSMRQGFNYPTDGVFIQNDAPPWIIFSLVFSLDAFHGRSRLIPSSMVHGTSRYTAFVSRKPCSNDNETSPVSWLSILALFSARFVTSRSIETRPRGCFEQLLQVYSSVTRKYCTRILRKSVKQRIGSFEGYLRYHLN